MNFSYEQLALGLAHEDIELSTFVTLPEISPPSPHTVSLALPRKAAWEDVFIR